jgi:hypothetical protein
MVAGASLHPVAKDQSKAETQIRLSGFTRNTSFKNPEQSNATAKRPKKPHLKAP